MNTERLSVGISSAALTAKVAGHIRVQLRERPEKALLSTGRDP